MKRFWTYTAKELFSLLAAIIVMSALIFLLVELMPGDVAHIILGQSATEEAVAALRESRGLDKPALQRYFIWMGGILQGDLGESIYMQGVSVNSLLWRRVAHSLTLALTAFLLFVPLSIFFGVLAAVKEE